MNWTCNANDSTYIFIPNEVDLGTSFMIMKTLFRNIIFFVDDKDTLNAPNANLLRYLLQRDQKQPGGIQA